MNNRQQLYIFVYHIFPFSFGRLERRLEKVRLITTTATNAVLLLPVSSRTIIPTTSSAVPRSISVTIVQNVYWNNSIVSPVTPVATDRCTITTAVVNLCMSFVAITHSFVASHRYGSYTVEPYSRIAYFFMDNLIVLSATTVYNFVKIFEEHVRNVALRAWIEITPKPFKLAVDP